MWHRLRPKTGALILMTPERSTYEVIFRRCWEVRFISHLDILRALSRALRRSGLDLYFTEGFNPKPKISYLSNPLAVGHTSECERFRFQLIDDVEAERAGERLFAQLPRGLSPEKITLLSSGDDESIQYSSNKLEYFVLMRKCEGELTCTERINVIQRTLSDENDNNVSFARELTREDIESTRLFADESVLYGTKKGMSLKFVSEYYSGGFILNIPSGNAYRRPEKWLEAAGVDEIATFYYHRKREVT